MCRTSFRTGSFPENGRKCFQSIALCCVSKGRMNQIGLTISEIYHCCESDHLVTLHRINDNEGAAEMLIDTLGASIVNATDSKGR